MEWWPQDTHKKPAKRSPTVREMEHGAIRMRGWISTKRNLQLENIKDFMEQEHKRHKKAIEVDATQAPGKKRHTDPHSTTRWMAKKCQVIQPLRRGCMELIDFGFKIKYAAIVREKCLFLFAFSAPKEPDKKLFIVFSHACRVYSLPRIFRCHSARETFLLSFIRRDCFRSLCRRALSSELRSVRFSTPTPHNIALRTR